MGQLMNNYYNVNSINVSSYKEGIYVFNINDKPSLTIWKPDGTDRGYLGIGTDNPTEMAHVVGTLLKENLIFKT
jgi:hypothetical protein